MNIEKVNNISSLMLSEEEMINVLGGENNETITTQPTNPGTQNPDKCNKCDKCDKCGFIC